MNQGRICPEPAWGGLILSTVTTS